MRLLRSCTLLLTASALLPLVHSQIGTSTITGRADSAPRR
jgi:hypothetical protein